MEKNIPTAEDILDILIQQKNNASIEENNDSHKQNIETLKKWCFLHVEEALRQASNKAKIDIIFKVGWSDIIKDIHEINKGSIINSYPEENIK